MEHPTVFPSLIYDDAPAAIDFLVEAFGAERHAVYAADDGSIHHAELRFGNGIVMLGSSRADVPATRGARGGIYVVVDDPDERHARAQAAGAEIIRELNDTEYGSREFGARDQEGNSWSFGNYQPFAVDRQAEEAASA
ncbi:MAG: VOC family protein [Gaiellaceae bacterium]